jgi:hypothetical protein
MKSFDPMTLLSREWIHNCRYLGIPVTMLIMLEPILGRPNVAELGYQSCNKTDKNCCAILRIKLLDDCQAGFVAYFNSLTIEPFLGFGFRKNWNSTVFHKLSLRI